MYIKAMLFFQNCEICNWVLLKSQKKAVVMDESDHIIKTIPFSTINKEIKQLYGF